MYRLTYSEIDQKFYWCELSTYTNKTNYELLGDFQDLERMKIFIDEFEKLIQENKHIKTTRVKLSLIQYYKPTYQEDLKKSKAKIVKNIQRKPKFKPNI